MGCEGENSITKYPTSAIDNPKVFSIDPFSRFVMVTTLTPSRHMRGQRTKRNKLYAKPVFTAVSGLEVMASS